MACTNAPLMKRRGPVPWPAGRRFLASAGVGLRRPPAQFAPMRPGTDDRPRAPPANLAKKTGPMARSAQRVRSLHMIVMTMLAS